MQKKPPKNHKKNQNQNKQIKKPKQTNKKNQQKTQTQLNRKYSFL